MLHLKKPQKIIVLNNGDHTKTNLLANMTFGLNARNKLN